MRICRIAAHPDRRERSEKNTCSSIEISIMQCVLGYRSAVRCMTCSQMVWMVKEKGLMSACVSHVTGRGPDIPADFEVGCEPFAIDAQAPDDEQLWTVIHTYSIARLEVVAAEAGSGSSCARELSGFGYGGRTSQTVGKRCL